LGFWFSPDFSGKVHVKKMITKSKSAMNSLLLFARNLKFTERKHLGLLYESLVSSQQYGTEFIFETSALLELDIVRRSYYKKLFDLANSVSNTFAQTVFFEHMESGPYSIFLYHKK
jgi:hypothetical protein